MVLYTTCSCILNAADPSTFVHFGVIAATMNHVASTGIPIAHYLLAPYKSDPALFYLANNIVEVANDRIKEECAKPTVSTGFDVLDGLLIGAACICFSPLVFVNEEVSAAEVALRLLLTLLAPEVKDAPTIGKWRQRSASFEVFSRCYEVTNP
jgi:hypothetical protein